MLLPPPLSGESEAGYSRLTGARLKDLEDIQVSAVGNECKRCTVHSTFVCFYA